MATQVDWNTQIKNKPTGYIVYARDFDWSAQTPSVTLTAGTAATITLDPWPSGLNTFSTNAHYLLITDTSSGDEEVLVTAISSGTSITFTPALNHTSGHWSIKSATFGIQEAHYTGLVQSSSSSNDSGFQESSIHFSSGVFTISQVFMNKRSATAESRLEFVGQGRFSTVFKPRSTTQSFFVWNGGYNVSYSSYLTFDNMGFQTPGTAYQTAGDCIRFDAYGYLTVKSCSFRYVYNGISSVGVSVTADIRDIYGYGIVNNLIKIQGYQSSPYYASAFQISNVFGHGRYTGSAAVPATEGLATSLINIKGSISSGVLSNMRLQAAYTHVGIVNGPNLSVGSIQISNSVFDQDSDPTKVLAAIIVSNVVTTSVADNSNIKIVGCSVNTGGYGVLSEYVKNVTVADCTIRCFGTNASLLFNTCRNCVASNNVLVDRYRRQASFVNIINTLSGAGVDFWLKDNVAKTNDELSTGGNIPTFLDFQVYPDSTSTAGTTTYGDRIYITNNVASRTTQLIQLLTSTLAFPHRERMYIKGNVVPEYAPTPVTAASIITIPFDDDNNVIAVTGTETITRILGGQAGMQRTFIAAGALAFGTNTSEPGGIVTSKAITGNEVFTANYYASDALMRISKSA